MFSDPPPTVISASPKAIARYPMPIAAIAEQHARSTVNELHSSGRPALKLPVGQWTY